MESAVADAFRERDVPDPELTAALIAAAYRTVHLAAIRRILRGAAPAEVEQERSAGLAHAFGLIDSICDQG